MERVKRMEIAGLPVSRVNGALYHLFHYRYENSRFNSSKQEKANREEFLKICSMDKEQLMQYVQAWRMSETSIGRPVL